MSPPGRTSTVTRPSASAAALTRAVFPEPLGPSSRTRPGACSLARARPPPTLGPRPRPLLIRAHISVSTGGSEGRSPTPGPRNDSQTSLSGASQSHVCPCTRTLVPGVTRPTGGSGAAFPPGCPPFSLHGAPSFIVLQALSSYTQV